MRSGLALVCSLAWVSACAGLDPGEVLVRIEIDPRLLVEDLHIELAADGADPMVVDQPVRGDGFVSPPYTVAIRRAGSTEFATLTVEGRGADGMSTTQRVRLRIVPGVTYVDVSLDASCHAVRCASEESCLDGVCQPVATLEGGSACRDQCLGRCESGQCLPSWYRPLPTVALGAAHTCALIEGVPRCWGSNEHLQLGGSVVDRVSTPAIGGRVIGLTAAVAQFSEVDMSGDYTCAQVEGGEVLCWGGTNSDGQLGPRGFVPDSPSTVTLPGATRLAALENALFWIDPRGRVRVQGGRLLEMGVSIASGEELPLPDGESAIDLSVSGEVGCAILASRRVACWGPNRAGVADPEASDPATLPPTLIAGLADVVRIAVSADHACAIDRAGALRCWGTGSTGSLCREMDRRESVDIELLEPAMEVAVGFESTCVVTVTGRTFCCGYRFDGDTWWSPREVAGLPRVDAVVSSEAHHCAHALDGGVWCWDTGDGNNSGEVLPSECDVDPCESVPLPRRVVLP